MSLSGAILSGVLQGLTEFFPISSSGHLVLLHRLFGIDKPQMGFDILLHAGTLIAILIFFRRDIISLFISDRGTILAIAVATIPALIAGGAFKIYFISLFKNTGVVGIGLIITAAWLFIGQSLSNRFDGQRSALNGQLKLWQAVIIGLAQAAALVPGISRSGATIATALACGADRERAFRFSFLLAVPAIAAAEFFELLTASGGLPRPAAAAGGIVASLIVGLLTLRLLSGIVRRGRLHYFSGYCLLTGLLTLALL